MAPSPRSALAGALLALVLASCSRSAPSSNVTAGSAAGEPTTTVVAVTADGDSPVAGVSPSALRAAVEQPAPASSRALRGAVAERIVLADGTALWRIRIPGPFPVRAARSSVLVGDRVVGAGIVTADLGSMVAVTADATGLTAGAPVSVRWEGQPSEAAGTLAVAR